MRYSASLDEYPARCNGNLQHEFAHMGLDENYINPKVLIVLYSGFYLIK
jgi:hypothetical protein